MEAVYQEALEREFVTKKINYERECPLPIVYRGRVLLSSYRTDFICFGSLLVELKALVRLSGHEEAQVLNYLKASGLKKALLLNFGSSRLEYKRFVFNHSSSIDRCRVPPPIPQMNTDEEIEL